MSDDGSEIDRLVARATAVAAPAMALTLYFRSSAGAFRDGVIRCVEEYLARFAPRIAWYADEDVGKIKPATPRLLAYPVKRLRDAQRPMPFFAFTAFSGARLDSAGEISLEALVRQDEPRKLSYLRASFPIADHRGAERAAAFVEMARAWAAGLPLVHGYGGLALNQPAADEVRQQQSAAVFAVARRFPGFEVEDCGGTVLVAQEAIKGVNWLTLLGDRMLARAGGEAALREKLSPAILLHPLAGGGLLVQAGPEPQLGDTNRGDRLPLYGEVARALAPIRLKEHPALGPVELGSFGPKGTAEWLRRFD